LSFYLNRALHDPFKRQEDWQDNPRLIALKAILSNYSDRPQVQELLRNRAEQDPDEQVREFAQTQLTQWQLRLAPKDNHLST
jgi:hypothetical protein